MRDGFGPLVTPVVFHGPGSLAELEGALELVGTRRPAIVSDVGLAGVGLVGEIASRLGAADRVWTEVPESPTPLSIEALAAFVEAVGADGLVAIGGGSPIDAAKSAAVLVSHGGPLGRWFGEDKIPGPTLPLIALPSTAGSGSDCNWHVAVLDPEAATKRAIRSVHLCPRAAILDPDLLRTLPAAQAAASGIDALAHALEAYTSADADVLSDPLDLGALRLLGENLERFVAAREDTAAAHGQMIAAALAGIGVCQARTGLVHSMARPAVGRLGISHGSCVGLLLPAVAAFNLPACRERYDEAAAALGLDGGAEHLVDWLGEFRDAHFRPPAQATAAVPWRAMAAEALADGGTARNPRQPSVEEAVAIFEEAFS